MHLKTTMRIRSRLLGGVAALLFATALGGQEAQSGGPKVGDLAPDFTLAAATKAGVNPTPITLSGLRGQTVVLAFFPKARTGGCTAQMEAYRDQYATLFNDGNGVIVLAISTDDAPTLHDWAAEKSFPVTFLSDKDATVGQLYDVKAPALNINRRVLFVIGPDGRVRHVMRPFRELSADAYTELGEAVRSARGG